MDPSDHDEAIELNSISLASAAGGGSGVKASIRCSNEADSSLRAASFSQEQELLGQPRELEMGKEQEYPLKFEEEGDGDEEEYEDEEEEEEDQDGVREEGNEAGKKNMSITER